MNQRPNKSLQATRDGGSSSAFAVHAIWSRVPELWALGRDTSMMLNRRSKYLSGGWTSVDMLMVMLAAGVAALLVSICFGRELRVGVFFISYLVFVAIFTSLFFSWLMPMLMRRQLQDAFLREHPGATILSTTSNDAIDTPGPRNIGFVYRNADGTEHQDLWHFGYSDHGWHPVKKEQIR